MIDYLNNKVIIKLSENKIIQNKDVEIYRYGLDLLSATIIKIVGLGIIALLLGVVKETFLFIICFSSLRIQAGGIHANTLLKCFIMTVVLTFGSIYLVGLLTKDQYIYFQVLSILLSIILVFRYAPIESSNKPLTNEEGVLYKSRSMATVVIWGIIILMINILYGSKTHFGNIASIGLLTESLTLLPLRLKLNK